MDPNVIAWLLVCCIIAVTAIAITILCVWSDYQTMLSRERIELERSRAEEARAYKDAGV